MPVRPFLCKPPCGPVCPVARQRALQRALQRGLPRVRFPALPVYPSLPRANPAVTVALGPPILRPAGSTRSTCPACPARMWDLRLQPASQPGGYLRANTRTSCGPRPARRSPTSTRHRHVPVTPPGHPWLPRSTSDMPGRCVVPRRSIMNIAPPGIASRQPCLRATRRHRSSPPCRSPRVIRPTGRCLRILGRSRGTSASAPCASPGGRQ